MRRGTIRRRTWGLESLPTALVFHQRLHSTRKTIHPRHLSGVYCLKCSRTIVFKYSTRVRCEKFSQGKSASVRRGARWGGQVRHKDFCAYALAHVTTTDAWWNLSSEKRISLPLLERALTTMFPSGRFLDRRTAVIRLEMARSRVRFMSVVSMLFPCTKDFRCVHQSKTAGVWVSLHPSHCASGLCTRAVIQFHHIRLILCVI